MFVDVDVTLLKLSNGPLVEAFEGTFFSNNVSYYVCATIEAIVDLVQACNGYERGSERSVDVAVFF